MSDYKERDVYDFFANMMPWLPGASGIPGQVTQHIPFYNDIFNRTASGSFSPGVPRTPLHTPPNNFTRGTPGPSLDQGSVAGDFLSTTLKGIGDIPNVVGQGAIQGGIDLAETGVGLAEQAGQIVAPFEMGTPLPGTDIALTDEQYNRFEREFESFLDKNNREPNENEMLNIINQVKGTKPGLREKVSETLAPIRQASQQVVEESALPPIGKKFFGAVGHMAVNYPLMNKMSAKLGPVGGFALHSSLQGLSKGDLKEALIGSVSGGAMGKISTLTGGIVNRYARALVEAGGFGSIEQAEQAVLTGKLPGLDEDTMTSALLGFTFGFTKEGKPRLPKEIKPKDVRKVVDTVRLSLEEMMNNKGGNLIQPGLIELNLLETKGMGIGPVKSKSKVLQEADKFISNKKLENETALSKMKPFKESNRFYRSWVNREASVEKLDPYLKRQGIDINDLNNPRLLIVTARGWMQKANAALERGPFSYNVPGKEGGAEFVGVGLKQIYNDFSKSTGLNIRETKRVLDDFFEAKRTLVDLQRKVEVPEKDPKTGKVILVKKPLASPEDTTRAHQKMRNLTDNYGEIMPHMEEALKFKNRFQHQMLDMSVEAGLISKEAAAQVKAENPNHVPFSRMLLDQDTSFWSFLKPFKGSSAEVYSPTESMMGKTYALMRAMDSNRLKLSITNLAEGLPPGTITKVKRDVRPTDIMVDEMVRQSRKENPNMSEFLANKMKEEISSMTIFRPDRVPLGEGEMLLYRNGSPEVWKVPKSISNLFKYEDVKSAKLGVELMKQIAKAPADMLKTGATLHPVFIANNLMRDAWVTFIQTQTGVKGLTVDPFRSAFDMFGKKDSWYKYLADGGGMDASMYLGDRKATRKRYREIMGNPGLLKRLNVVTSLQDVGHMVEAFNRFRVYETARSKGLSGLAAAAEARESSIDFARAGELGRVWNKYTPFFNAGIQGGDRFFRQMKNKPFSTTAKAAATVTLAEALFYAYNNRNEEAKERHLARPRWQKDYFWPVELALGFEINIPKPFGYGQLFGSLFGRAMEYMKASDPKALDGTLNMLLQGFSPTSGEGFADVMPTALKLAFELGANKNTFTDRPIVPHGKENLLPKHQSTTYGSEFGKWLGSQLGEEGVSPAKIDHLIKGLGGRTNRELLGLVDKAFFPKADRPPSSPAIKDAPVVGGFFGRDPMSNPEQLNSFYEKFGELSKASTSISRLRKEFATSRDPAKLQEIRDIEEDYPDATGNRWSIINNYAKSLKSFNNQVNAIITNRNMSDEEKRKRIQGIQKRRYNVVKRAYKYMFFSE
jgi:hypothetical protein